MRDEEKLYLEYSIYELLKNFSINILDKTTINELFTNAITQNFKERFHNQLKLFDL